MSLVSLDGFTKVDDVSEAKLEEAEEDFSKTMIKNISSESIDDEIIIKHKVTLTGSQHKKSGYDGTKYHCKDCGKHFLTMSSLTRHKRIIHDGIKYPCDYCQYQATTKRNLVTQRTGRILK